MTFTDETVMAFVDGELDEKERAAVSAALATDPELARQVARYRALREQLRGEFAAVLEERVPERLVVAARGGAASPVPTNVIALKARPTMRRSWPQWGAMAASLAVGVLIAPFLWRQGAREPVVVQRGQMVASDTLAFALSEQLASTQAADARIGVGVSFLSRDGSYCRTFVLRDQSAVAGLACHEHDQWRLEALAAAAPSSAASGQYRPAASSLPAAVARTLDELIVGEPLDASAESAARARGWRR
jgi:negative regulator of sigma E activity